MDKQYLVSTDWLAAHLHDANVRIVDIRGHVAPASDPLPHYYNHREDYEREHITGAVFVDWVQEITDPDDPRHAQIAKPERFAEAMRRHGIGVESFVVVYDDAGGMFAARLWWALNYYGHGQVAVLDGGWQKWVAEGRPTDAEIPVYAPSDFVATPDPAWYRSADQVLASLETATLIDVRTPAEFEGKASRAARGGHIPNAINLPRGELVSADGTFLAPEALREKFAAFGVSADSADIVTYCNGGVSASYGLLALKLAGLDGAMYDGSWKEWGNSDNPIS